MKPDIDICAISIEIYAVSIGVQKYCFFRTPDPYDRDVLPVILWV